MPSSGVPKYVADFWSRSESDVLKDINGHVFPTNPNNSTFEQIPKYVLTNSVYKNALEKCYKYISKVCDDCDFDNGLHAAVYNSLNKFLKSQLSHN